jgi:hypothetical protein
MDWNINVQYKKNPKIVYIFSKVNVSSLGGSLTKVESLTLSNFTRNLFRSIWHRFDFPKSLSSVVCEILTAAHALTGCDTTSSFFGIGKNSIFKALKEPPNQFSDLSRIAWFSRSKPKTNIKAVWSEGKVETMPYRSELWQRTKFYARQILFKTNTTFTTNGSSVAYEVLQKVR